MNIWLDPRAPLSFPLTSVNSGDCCPLEPEGPRLHMTVTVGWKVSVPGFRLQCFLFISQWWLSSDGIPCFVIAEDLIQHITVRALWNGWKPGVIIIAMNTDHHYGSSNVSPELLCLMDWRHSLKIWKKRRYVLLLTVRGRLCVYASTC